MKALVISGEISCPRPISYGLTGDIETKTLGIIDQEFLSLCEKYGDAKNISTSEMQSFIKRSYESALSAVQSDDFDVIVGVGYGAQVLINLNNSYEWRGPSVFVFTEGTARTNVSLRPLPDEIDFDTRPVCSAIIVVDDSTQKIGSSVKRVSQDLHVLMHINISPGLWDSLFQRAGILLSCVKSIVQFNN